MEELIRYTATEIAHIRKEAYYQGRAEEAEKWKEKIDYLEDLLWALETYYSITVEDLEKSLKGDK